MAVGIFNKLKKSFKALGQRIGGFAKRAVAALPQIASVGKQVIGAVSPILTNVLPGSGIVLNGLNKTLDYAAKFGQTFSGKNNIGKSLLSEID